MSTYTHFFHLKFIFLLFINTNHLIILCHSKRTTPNVESSEEQFFKWNSNNNNINNNKVSPSIITVDQDPTLGNFQSIQSAIDSLPKINTVRVIIKVHAGVYTEKVTIPPTKSCITIQGAGAENTIVRWNDTAGTPGPDGQPLGTYGSATFGVNSPNFIAMNITFQNTTPIPPPGAANMQAVALRISADAAAFVGCRFLGGQDTLYDQKGRHYYKDCFIEGSVDFIFGNGLSLFEKCELHSICPEVGALTAQGRKSGLDETGFSFVNCNVTGTGKVFLGRAWKPFSRVVFANTLMDSNVNPLGWFNWDDPSREMDVFYGEYNCSGPGANVAGRVPWSRVLTDEEAQVFTSLDFIHASQWLNLSSLHSIA